MTDTTAPSGDTGPTQPRPGPSLRAKILLSLSILIIGVVITEFAIRPFVSPDIVGPSAAKYDAYYGKALKSGYSGSITSNGCTYQLDVNSAGFRGPEWTTTPKNAVLFFGDSYGFGSTVDNDEAYADIIRRRLADRFGDDAFPVVNAAIAGNGQGRWLRFLKRDAEQFEPRFVVMQFCNNDFRNNHTEKLYALEEDGTLRERPIGPQSTFRAVQEKVEALPVLPYSRIYAILKQTIKNTFTNEGERAEQALDGAPDDTRTVSDEYDDPTLAITEACLEICASHGWDVVGVSSQLPEGDERLVRLRALFARYGHEFIAIPPKAARPDLHNITIDEHWNAAGHEHVATLLLERMMTRPTFANAGSAPNQGDADAAPAGN